MKLHTCGIISKLITITLKNHCSLTYRNHNKTQLANVFSLIEDFPENCHFLPIDNVWISGGKKCEMLVFWEVMRTNARKMSGYFAGKSVSEMPGVNSISISNILLQVSL